MRVKRGRARVSPRPFCSTASPPNWASGSPRCCAGLILAVDLGTPTDAVRQVLAASGKIGDDRRCRFCCDPSGQFIPARRPPTRRRCLSQIGSLDLVVSALTLQFVNDLPGTLIQIRHALKPDGLLLAALIGGERLAELRAAFAAAESEVEGGISPRVAPFADVRELGALLQRAGFALPVVDIERLTVRYDTPFALMHDLRRMGATNVLHERRRAPLRRATLRTHGGNLCRAFCRCGRPRARDLRNRLAVGLGAARKPAEAAQTGLGCARGSPTRSAPRKSRRGKSQGGDAVPGCVPAPI